MRLRSRNRIEEIKDTPNTKQLEYWQWITDPKKLDWCAMSIRNVHGTDKQIICGLHRAATREPEFDAEFRMMDLMAQTGERTLFIGDQIQITEGKETRCYRWNGRSWENA